MKRLLTILLLLPFIGISQTTTFSLSQIPIGTDFLNADRGAHLWINRDAPHGTIDLPVNNAPQEMMDGYYRFSWTHFFTGTGLDSTINWSFFRARMGEFTAKRMGIKFRIMSNGRFIGTGNGNFNNNQEYDGSWSNTPEFLHNLQQAEPNPANRDHQSSFGGGPSTWVPNTNSPQYQRWVRKFSQQLRNYIDTAVINGHPLRFAIRIYDLGFYGCYSEQHSNCLCNNISELPAGFRPNNNNGAGLIEIVDAQLDAMGGNSNWKYVIPFNSLDAIWLGHTLNPVAYGQYLIDHPDSISFVNDHLGANEGYDHSYWEDNNRLGSRGGTPRQTILNNRWRYSPHGGEPVGWGVPADRSAIPQYVQLLHLSGFGNGNLDHIAANGQDDDGWPTEANNIRTASRLAGYRLKVTGGSATVGANLSISLNWINEGNAPVYFPWTVQYLIKNGGGSIVSTLTSSFQVRYFQPTGASNNITQSFTMPAIPVGSYGLYVRVVDANNYRNPMFLANTPRQADGSYFLGNITLGGGTNLPPVANAGPNQSITGTSVSLNGSSSTDADGTITTYAWTQLPGGPNTATIVSPSSANTNVTGLIPGVYVFNLTVTDDDGATGSDQVQITVGGNQPPVANAGANQSISLPTTSATVNGSASFDDVAITAYLWTQVGGPIIATIATPTTASSSITGMTTAGTYTFRLRVQDGSGLFSTDDMNIIVGTGNNPPIANAGPNVTIVLPTNFTQLNGTASTDDVGITSYMWTKVGGPVTYSIPSPNFAIANAESLQEGIYIFRLTVCDVGGLCNSDDVQVTVLSTAPAIPVANAGANQTITLPTSSVSLSASGSTGTITSYSWSKVSGPVSHTFGTPTSVNTTASSLVQGVYEFRVTVCNTSGCSFDDVTITVLPPANAGPIAVAGNNQSITLPTSSTSVDGSASTDDVAVTVYLWTKVSGPAGGTIATPNSATTSITALQQGTYVFRLRVQDVAGLFDTDDLSIVVNTAANNAPVAIITTGTPIIQLPTNTVALSGTSSTDDVAVTGYLWAQISGPSTATIATPTASTTNMNNLIAGVYFFQLEVSDAGGLTDTDIVMITVNAATPSRPILDGHTLFRTGVKFLPRHGHP